MKDFLVKEFFWFILGSVIALPLSFFFLRLFDLTSAGPTMNEIENIFYLQLYIIGWFVSLICVYIIRAVVSAIIKKL